MIDNLAYGVKIESTPFTEPWLAALRSDLAEAVGRALQQATDEAGFCCPRCRSKLNVLAHRKERTVSSVFGDSTFRRSYGSCPHCGESSFPADARLGLAPRANASPRMQEVCASMVLSAPTAVAAESDACLMGLGLSASTMYREALRQGRRAMDLRDADAHLTQTPEGITEPSSRATPGTTPFTLVVEIDAWDIRERNN